MTKDEEERFNAAVAGLTMCGHATKEEVVRNFWWQASGAVSLAGEAATNNHEFRIPFVITKVIPKEDAPLLCTFDLPSAEEVKEYFTKQWQRANGWVSVDVDFRDLGQGKFWLLLVFYNAQSNTYEKRLVEQAEFMGEDMGLKIGEEVESDYFGKGVVDSIRPSWSHPVTVDFGGDPFTRFVSFHFDGSHLILEPTTRFNIRRVNKE